MKTLLKVLGWVFAFIAVFGGLPVMARDGVSGPTFGAFMVWVVLSVACFLGGREKK